MADDACRSSSHSGLVNQLSRLVETLRDQNTDTQRRASTRDNRLESVGAAITRLFPSVNGRPSSASTTSEVQSGASTVDVAGETRGKTHRFEPGGAKQTKRKKPNSTKKVTGTSGSAVMKDVILLPNPRIKSVPRGRVREELYVQGFVATAFSLTNELTASEIQEQFASLFSNKLRGRCFNIVRAVGNRIVDVNLPQTITGKILKHMCGQGPVYLRCMRPTATDYSWVEEDDSDDEDSIVAGEGESGSDDLPETGLVSAKHPSSTQVVPPTTSVTKKHCPSTQAVTATTNAVQGHCAYSSSTTPNRAPTSSAPSISNAPQSGTVACPTCNLNFTMSEIEQHADQCCERNSSEASLYGTWVLKAIDLTGDDSMDEEYNMDNQQRDDTSNSKCTSLTTKELIQSLQVHVSDATNRIAVRRKFLWDDYVTARKKPWFKTDAALCIQFIGEPAVDGGGPRREFFTEMLDAIQSRLFVNDSESLQDESPTMSKVPHESTIAIASGHFIIAGEVMATSIVQGGPAPDFLSGWVYTYLSFGIESITVDENKIADQSTRHLLNKLQKADSDKAFQAVLMEDDVLDQLAEIGYRGVPHRETLKNRSSLIRYSKIHVALYNNLNILLFQ